MHQSSFITLIIIITNILYTIPPSLLILLFNIIIIIEIIINLLLLFIIINDDAGELPVMMPPLKRSVPHPHFSCFSRTSWRRKIALEGLKYLLFFLAFRLSLIFGKNQNGRLDYLP